MQLVIDLDYEMGVRVISVSDSSLNIFNQTAYLNAQQNNFYTGSQTV